MRILPGLGYFRASSFHVNAFYLMFSTFVLAGSGFIFWSIITRMYDATSVGLATTLLSVSGLLSLLGLAGFDTTFVRFLPRSRQKNNYINSGFVIVAIIASTLSSLVAFLLPFVLPQLQMLHSPWFFAGFIFFTVISALNVLTNAVFLAYKQARYIFVINTLFSVVKIILPFIFAPLPGGELIFVFVGVSQLVGFILSIVWMRQKFSYTFSLTIDKKALVLIRKFSSSVYVSSILNLLPPTLIPLIITYLLSPKDAAYYYMAFTIAGALYTVAYASMQSVFAEGSHDEAALHAHVKKAAKLIALLLIPATFFTVLISYFLLLFFGREYAVQASGLLQIFAVSALPVALYSAFGAIFKVTKNLAGVVAMNAMYALVIIVGSYIFIPLAGINGVGWSWLAGNVAACFIGALFLLRAKKQGGRIYDEI